MGSDMHFLLSVLKATTALFIIIDPIGLIPVFMALTYQATPEERQDLFKRAFLVAFVLLVLFTLTGTGILKLFNISLSDFRIAGGILLLIIALRIINEAHYTQATEELPGVVPLAVPLLVGPGAITTAIVMIGTYGLGVTITAVVLSLLISYIIFHSVEFLYRLLGQTGSDVFAKIMGMLLAAIAVQFMRQGIEDIFHV